MKILTKLALVSAVAISGHAFALQSLNDTDLSATTGQDGIDIKLSTGAAGIIADSVVIHDKDGVGSNYGVSASNAGAIVLGKYNDTGAGEQFKITGGDITVKVDSDGNGTSPVLNINVGLPAALAIETGNIYVAKSGGIAAASSAQYSNEVKVLDNITLALNGATLNIQLGNQPQGTLIKLGGTITSGLTINNLNILQGTNGIRLDSVNVKSVNSNDWTLDANINAVPAGLEISNLGNLDVRLGNVKLGATSAASIGDVALLGLSVPNVTISGH